jgi:hypothetical protein
MQEHDPYLSILSSRVEQFRHAGVHVRSQCIFLGWTIELDPQNPS